ncbi:hypothetical protein F5879DRAFT_346111 [Lentinula edodes]|nr:hypothetical protein F5879DRAFT_346111 [Lentinula edodes]
MFSRRIKLDDRVERRLLVLPVIIFSFSFVCLFYQKEFCRLLHSIFTLHALQSTQQIGIPSPFFSSVLSRRPIIHARSIHSNLRLFISGHSRLMTFHAHGSVLPQEFSIFKEASYLIYLFTCIRTLLLCRIFNEMYFYQTLAFMNLEVHVSTHSYDSRSLGRDSDIFEKNHYKSYTYLPESFDTTLQELNEYVVVEGLR